MANQMLIDAAIEALLKVPQDASLPPDRLLSAVYAVHVTAPEAFSSLTAALPRGLLRAKGFLHIGKGIFLFSWVMGKTELTEMPPASVPLDRCDRIIFIASPGVMDELAAIAAKSPFLSAISQQFDPMKCLTMASDRITSDLTAPDPMTPVWMTPDRVTPDQVTPDWTDK